MSQAQKTRKIATTKTIVRTNLGYTYTFKRLVIFAWMLIAFLALFLEYVMPGL